MTASAPKIPLSPLWPPLPAPPPPRLDPAWMVPTEAQCLDYWKRYKMPRHIREHSRKVAQVACFVAEAGQRQGLPACLKTVHASALLHDLAKFYCIENGGNHSQLGGAWVAELTGNPLLAQGVAHHVYWPFAVDLRRYFMPLCVLYADKRVAHDRIVPIEERFGDLVERYGKTPEIRERIHSTNQQAKEIEGAMSRLLEMDLSCAHF